MLSPLKHKKKKNLSQARMPIIIDPYLLSLHSFRIDIFARSPRPKCLASFKTPFTINLFSRFLIIIDFTGKLIILFNYCISNMSKKS
jgi:hypothetical protein